MAVPYTIVEMDKERKLRIDYKGLAELRHLAGISAQDLAALSEESEIGPDMIVKILWIAMRAEEKNMTLDTAWEIVGELGDTVVQIQQRAIEILSAVISDSFSGEGEEPKNAKAPTT